MKLSCYLLNVKHTEMEKGKNKMKMLECISTCTCMYSMYTCLMYLYQGKNTQALEQRAIHSLSQWNRYREKKQCDNDCVHMS